MYPTRKSSGSSAFLNRLQRNAQFGVDAQQSAADAADDDADLTPEELLAEIDKQDEWSIGSLAEAVSESPESLAEALAQLRGMDCIRIDGELDNPNARILITEIGRKTANFARITSAG